VRSYTIIETENEELKRQNRELVAKVERLEKLAEAARKFINKIDSEMEYLDLAPDPEVWPFEIALREELANLEGGGK